MLRDSTQRTDARRIKLPRSRGPWMDAFYALTGTEEAAGYPDPDGSSGQDILSDDDFQMALYLCYELHYAHLDAVDDRMEWSPVLLMFRAGLESAFEAALHDIAPAVPRDSTVGTTLQRLVRKDDGPPLSRYVETRATRHEVLEHVVHRSAYQLKEADPHSWAIPRLSGRAKAALVEIQADEYGAGRAERIHATLFANTMRGLGLDCRYGAYVDRLPGVTLATVNLMSLFGLHRRLRGALVGHLATFEMTSSVPNRRYGNAMRRLGYGEPVTDFYDEHVEADAVHECVALWDLADALGASEPALADDIIFGARALLALEARWAAHLLGAWARGGSSLTEPLAEVEPW
jgi:Iron-containing redox enzyme